MVMAHHCLARLIRRFRIVALTLVLLFSAGSAGAQILPDIDHYLVYRVTPSPTSGVLVQLQDQYTPTFVEHQVLDLRYSATPVSKDLVPIVDTQTHYSWYGITPHDFGASALVINQFGEQELSVREPVFLLAPALKNPLPGQTLPQRNHYKCYEASGPGPNRNVLL